MKNTIALLCFSVLTLLVPTPSRAADIKGCEGPAELCQQVLELNKKLDEQKAVNAKYGKKMDEKVAAATAEQEVKKEESMAKTIAFAALLAVILKGLLSAIKSWTPYFKGLKGKAWIQVVTLVVGFAAFIATNVGMGVPFWQSLILAGGGPGAMVIHDLMSLLPVLLGKKQELPSGTDSVGPA